MSLSRVFAYTMAESGETEKAPSFFSKLTIDIVSYSIELKGLANTVQMLMSNNCDVVANLLS